jgi:hypothetical protein
MTNSIQEIAEKVVDHFKQELSAEALSSLSAADWDRLAGLIRNAISQERENASAQLIELAQKMKADVEHLDLGL